MNNTEIQQLKAEFSKNSKNGQYQLAKLLCQENAYLTYGEITRILYVYKDGYYQNANNTVKVQIQNYIQELANKKTVMEIIEHMMIMTHQGKIDDIKDNYNFLNFKNGIYDIKNGILIDHSPDFKFFNQIPVVFNANLDCPIIKGFLNDVIDEEFIPILQEWAGFMLYRAYFIKKAMIITGQANTGKTTFLRLLSQFIGMSNHANVSLKELTSDKFAGQTLLHKYANICDELSLFDIKDTNPFKKATGNSPMKAEKKFQDATSFYNYAKLIFACNKIPLVIDIDDDAYFDRWIVVVFDRVIKKKDEFLLEKMTTEEELSGFLNFALIGLHRLLESRKFSSDVGRDEVKKIMLRNSSSIASFAYDMLENPDDPYLTITKDDMYQEYCKYCRQYGLRIETKESVGRDLKNYADYIHAEGGKIRTWANVKIKGQSTNLFDDTPIEHTPLEEFYTDPEQSDMSGVF